MTKISDSDRLVTILLLEPNIPSYLSKGGNISWDSYVMPCTIFRSKLPNDAYTPFTFALASHKEEYGLLNG